LTSAGLATTACIQKNWPFFKSPRPLRIKKFSQNLHAVATFFAPGRRAAFSKLKKSFKNFPAASKNSQTRFIVARNFAPVRQEKSPPPILQGRGVAVATFFGHMR
jgi:hypothetical protein